VKSWKNRGILKTKKAEKLRIEQWKCNKTKKKTEKLDNEQKYGALNIAAQYEGLW
jgi:hypothetical protein